MSTSGCKVLGLFSSIVLPSFVSLHLTPFMSGVEESTVNQTAIYGNMKVYFHPAYPNSVNVRSPLQMSRKTNVV